MRLYFLLYDALINKNMLSVLSKNVDLRYTNADLKISLDFCVCIKIIPWFFIVRILELFTREVCIFLKK